VTSDVPSSAQTLAAIERSLPAALPPGWALVRARPAKANPELEWVVRAPGGESATFAVRFHRSSPGRQLDALVGQPRDAGSRALVAAPFLSPTVREALAERGVSYADATGNLRLVADRPGLFVQRPGAHKDPWPTDDTLRSLRGRAAWRAVRALVDHRPPFGVRDLAKRATVPLGSLSRTLDLLDREGLVTRGERGEVLALDWERAIRRWAADYDFARSNRIAPYDAPGGLEAFGAKLRSPKRPYAVTGPQAALRLTGLDGTAPAGLYVEDLDLAVERLRLEPAPALAGANIVLTEGYDRVVFERPVARDGVRLAAPVQLAVDLLTWPDVPAGAADGVFGWMRANEEEWRA
jgi:hypothetical protein